MPYYYIASPYTHEDPAMRERRFLKVMDFTVFLLQNYSMHCYSPILHSHQMSVQHKMPYAEEFWRSYNEAMLEPACCLIVLQIDGSAESRGVKREISFAREIGIPILWSRRQWGREYDHEMGTEE